MVFRQAQNASLQTALTDSAIKLENYKREVDTPCSQLPFLVLPLCAGCLLSLFVSLLQECERAAERLEAETPFDKAPGGAVKSAGLQKHEAEIEALQQQLSKMQEEVMEMPKKQRKATKARITALEEELTKKVNGYKSERASQQASPGPHSPNLGGLSAPMAAPSSGGVVPSRC